MTGFNITKEHNRNPARWKPSRGQKKQIVLQLADLPHGSLHHIGGGAVSKGRFLGNGGSSAHFLNLPRPLSLPQQNREEEKEEEEEEDPAQIDSSLLDF